MDKVATLETGLKDEVGEMGWGLSTRGATKMGLVGMGVAIWDARAVMLVRTSRGVKGQGREMCSGLEGKRPRTTGDGVQAGDEAHMVTKALHECTRE